MKTLHLTNSWHANSGGISTFYKALFETANREKHEMRLVVPGETESIESVGEFGKLYRVRAPRAPLDPEYRIIYPNRFLFPQTVIQRILNAEQPDLVEISEKYTAPYLAGLLRTRRLPGVKFRPTTVGVSHERMDENMAAYLSGHPAAQAFCRWYTKSIYFPMCDHHIAVSDHTAEELILASRGHKIRRGIWVSPMGVDSDRFRPSLKSREGRAQLANAAGEVGPNTKILLYAGRLAPEKNLELLLETIGLLDPQEYTLVIAGDGIQFDTLKARCRRDRLPNVRFTGRVNDRELLARYYANADVFVHPNPREPFGIAPLEAMASGTALVAPNQGGVTTYANSRNAWPAAPNAAAFADAVRSAAADSEDRTARTIHARRTAEEHAWPLVTSRYLQLYRELHELTRGAATRTSIGAVSWSTPGDLLGRELIEL